MDISPPTWTGLNYDQIVERLIELARATALQHFEADFGARMFVSNWLVLPDRRLDMATPEEVIGPGNEGQERVAELLAATLNSRFKHLALLRAARLEVSRLERLLRPTDGLDTVHFVERGT